MSIHDCDINTLCEIMRFIDPYESADVRLVCRAFRTACGASPRKLTPAQMWKYAVRRGLWEQCKQACDVGARDLARYTRSRATFEECANAWKASFCTQERMCDGLCDGELVELRDITVRGDRSWIAQMLNTCVKHKLLRALGRYSDSDLIKAVITSDDDIRRISGRWITIIEGAIKEHRRELVRDIITHWREKLNAVDFDSIARGLATCALVCADVEMFEFITRGSGRVNILACCRSGKPEMFAFAKSRIGELSDNKCKDALIGAVCSGKIEMFREVFSWLVEHGPVIDINLKRYEGSIPNLAEYAMHRGNRAICATLLTWAESLRVIQTASAAMFRIALKEDIFWIADLVICRMRAAHGPRGADEYIRQLRDAKKGTCCEIMSRGL